ncbi:MAG: CoA:oxalate CoA-transferase [Clostridia bacterium]|nr:CoA:oxalate CoA-transferase [Clostridia bacterium]MDN5323956.1 CoA:oxalate CoA-transferase [Clostridia bacterium]
MYGALEGIRVTDLGHVLAAPTCTMILADLGAEVIKVEPPKGDDSRFFGPFIKEKEGQGEQSGYYISINRNKKSICVDLKEPEGKEILRKLIRVSDVLVENYRPGTLKKLGFPYEEIRKINPGIIYCSISGFGHNTLPEFARKPAYDMVAQAYSGLMSITGPEGGDPVRVGTSVGDLVAGHQAAIGILSALWHRQKTGVGQHVDISMVDGLIYMLENAIVRYTTTGEIPTPLGTAHPTITPFQSFKTKDHWIITPIGNDKLWHSYCEAIGRTDLINHPKFKTNHLRTVNRAELITILQEVMKTKSTKEWIEIFEKNHLPYSPLNTVDKVINDPNTKYRKMVTEIEQPNIGKVKIIGTPFKLSETPGTVSGHAPLLGENTNEVLNTLLNYSQEQITNLKKKNIIK